MLPLHRSDPLDTWSFKKIPFRRIPGRGLILTGIITLTLFWFAAPLSYLKIPRYELGGYHDDAELAETPSSGTVPASGEATLLWQQRKEQVRKAYVHAYSGYMKYAYPADELLATSGGRSNKFNGWSVTMLDSMDTMWIMGLHEEFNHAVQVVANQNFTMPQHEYAPFFETVIRYLGGLLSAYALSKEPILLTRADDLGTLLLPVFDATPSGFPAYSVSTTTGKTASGWTGDSILFSEATSCQLEFKYLARLTGREIYYTSVDHIMNKLYQFDPEEGLFALSWSWQGRPRDQHYSVGASADSGYEYLLKQYLLTNDTKALSQYLKSIDGIIDNLLYITPTRELLYVLSKNNNILTHNLEHLACFLPGVLALGAHSIPPHLLSPERRERHRWAAQGLAYTCYVSYVDMASGLGPDGLSMTPGVRWVEKLKEWESKGRSSAVVPGLKEEGKRSRGERDYKISSPVYLLRPETIESIYVMWKTTGDAKWRERGYEIFAAIERNAKTRYGYASVDRVDDEVVRQIDDMPSFFLAETLKYLYLLFDDSDSYPFSKWVFNTEAHPLPIFNWTDWEKKEYNIMQ